MIKFFRKIRQRLLTENKLSKYLIYAVGEIFLVVIGILIALGINNWNNQIKNDFQAQKVLSALHSEFTKNKIQLTKVKSYHIRVRNACNNLLDLIANFPNKYSESCMDSLLAEYGYFMSFDPYNSVLKAAISSGEIHIIKNDSLVNLLFSWPSLVLDANEEEIQAKQLLFQHIDFFSKYVREVDIWSRHTKSPFDSDYIGLLKNPDFENKVHFRLSIVRELVREQNIILETNNIILNLIENEVK